MFLSYSYLPLSFMDSTIVPLVKCKNGDLTDVDNYRAIAISTALVRRVGEACWCSGHNTCFVTQRSQVRIPAVILCRQV